MQRKTHHVDSPTHVTVPPVARGGSKCGSSCGLTLAFKISHREEFYGWKLAESSDNINPSGWWRWTVAEECHWFASVVIGLIWRMCSGEQGSCTDKKMKTWDCNTWTRSISSGCIVRVQYVSVVSQSYRLSHQTEGGYGQGMDQKVKCRVSAVQYLQVEQTVEMGTITLVIHPEGLSLIYSCLIVNHCTSSFTVDNCPAQLHGLNERDITSLVQVQV